MAKSKSNYPEIVFICRKCGHELFMNKNKIFVMLSLDCPNCGEEPNENWILSREGSYEREYGGK